jgi:predicted exporter
MKKQTPTLVIIVILTLVTVVFWVGFSIINRLKTKTSLNIPDQVLEPISPNLNQEILDKLETRTFFVNP